MKSDEFLANLTESCMKGYVALSRTEAAEMN